jgi:hypothetical protein
VRICAFAYKFKVGGENKIPAKGIIEVVKFIASKPDVVTRSPNDIGLRLLVIGSPAG